MLEDQHVLELSTRITCTQELMNLGINGLKLPRLVIQSAVYRHKDSIQEATYTVLTSWVNQQETTAEAYINIITAFNKCKMNHLASELKEWVNGAANTSQISQESVLKDPHILELSTRITSAQDLLNLGINGLKLPRHIIQSAVYNHKESIQDAAYTVLKSWAKQQETTAEAYINIVAALQECNMPLLANELRLWAESADFTQQISKEKSYNLQMRVKDSLDKKFKKCLKHDWIEHGHNFPLVKYYTDLTWVRKVHEALGIKMIPMKSMDEMLYFEGAGRKCLKILVEAGIGMGKTSSMAMLAMKWVKDRTGEFPFDFVFFIPLRNVDDNSSLAKLVVDEHNLEKEDIDVVQAILTGRTIHKVILLLDDCDQLPLGTNYEIEQVLEKTLGKCLIILTSCSHNAILLTNWNRNKIDVEVVIKGFSAENIKKCCSHYLGSEMEAVKFLQDAKRAGLYELLYVPIILLIMCVLYNEDEKKSFPEQRTKLFQDLYQFLMDRSTLTTHRCYSCDIPRLQKMLEKLGKIAWMALHKDVKPLLIEQEDLMVWCGTDVMTLGLLHIVGDQKVTARKQPVFLAFHHKRLQQFGASIFVTGRLRTAENVQETLTDLFPSWEVVETHREVVIFTTGLMIDPSPLLDHVYKMQIEHSLNTLRGTTDDLSIDEGLFQALNNESKVPLPDHPLHNKYINYYNHKKDDQMKRPRDTTRMYVPSRLFVLHAMMEYVSTESREKLDNMEIPKCAISIQEPNEAISKSLLTTCIRICKDQTVTDLQIAKVNEPDSSESHEFNLSKNIKSMSIRDCQFSPRTQTHLLQQLSKGEFLTLLNLQGTTIGKDGHHIAKSIRSWKGVPALQKIQMGYCSMSKGVCTELVKSLSLCRKLTDLDLSGNRLAGSLLHFLPDPYQGLPSLTRLELNHTSLNKGDVQHLKNLIRMKKVPGLRSLGLMGNRLHDMEEEFEGLISNCLDNHAKNLNLKIGDKGQPKDFEAKWMRVLEGKHVSINAMDYDEMPEYTQEQLDEAYERALNEGYEEVFLARMNLVGFHEAGKTSLAKRLLGEEFDPREESTEGIALHYIESTFNKDTQRVASWNKTDISADDLHKEVMKQMVSHLEAADREDTDNEDTYTKSTDDDHSQEYTNTNVTHEEYLHNEKDQNDAMPPSEKQVLQKEPTVEWETLEPFEQKAVLSGETQETKHGKIHKDTDENMGQVATSVPNKKPNSIAGYSSEQISASRHNSSDSEQYTPFTLRLWDLGGQNDFMTTHHLFLDVGAATLIVIDVTKEFDKPFKIYEKIQNKEKDLRLKRTNPQTPEHILHYWLNTFFVDDTKKNDLGLNIAIVLTHIDHIEKRYRDQHIKNYKDRILLSLRGKPYEHLIKEDTFFEVDNKGANDNDLQNLRDELFKMFKKQRSWGYKMPTRWIRLQAEILHRAEKVLKFSTGNTMASEIGLGDEDLKSFLDLHRSLGNFLYFNQTRELAKNIITDPKWLVEKCKEVITHPEFIDKRNLRPVNQESKIATQAVEEILEKLKKGFVTEKGLQVLWKGSEVEFLTSLMLKFDLFFPMVESQESNRQYLISCMLPSHEEKEDEVRAEDMVYLYDASQEAECGDWFKVGEFDKLLAFFARALDWKLSKNPSPSYGRAYFESEKHSFSIQLSLESMESQDKQYLGRPSFRVVMYCRRNTLKKDAKDTFRSFTLMIAQLRKTKTILHDRMGVINIKQAREFKVLCPNYDPEQDEYSTLIDAEEENDGIVRVPEGPCPCHDKLLPSDQYTWLIQNVLLNEDGRRGIEGYDAALLSGNEFLRGRNSDVMIQIPAEIKDVLCRKVYTEFSKRDMMIPEDESIIAPVVEVHLKNIKIRRSGEGSERIFAMKIPHCLQSEDDWSKVVLRYGEIHQLSKMQTKEEYQSKGTGPYFEVDSRHIIVHASHFCFLVPSFLRGIYLPFLKTVSCVTMVQSKHRTTTGVTVNVYLCSPVCQIVDFWKQLTKELKQQSHVKTDCYVMKDCPIDLEEDFNLERSKCVLVLRPEKDWKDAFEKTKKTEFSKTVQLTKRLLGVNQWSAPHERKAHGFELTIEESRDLFEGELMVSIVSPTKEKSEVQMRFNVESQAPKKTKDEIVRNKSVTLDKVILRLSNLVTNKKTLLHIAIELDIELSLVETEWTNTQRNITDTTYEVMKDWRLRYGDTEEAFDALIIALQECRFNQMATELESLWEESE